MEIAASIHLPFIHIWLELVKGIRVQTRPVATEGHGVAVPHRELTMPHHGKQPPLPPTAPPTQPRYPRSLPCLLQTHFCLAWQTEKATVYTIILSVFLAAAKPQGVLSVLPSIAR